MGLSFFEALAVAALIVSSVAVVNGGITLDCDPCIDRRVSRLAAILPRDNGEVIQAALQQAAADMNVELSLYHDLSETNADNDNHEIDAWIVTLGDSNGVTESDVRRLLTQDQVIFGWGWGYQSSVAQDAAGWMASNDREGGRLAANQFVEIFLERQQQQQQQQQITLVDNTTETSITAVRAAVPLEEELQVAFVVDAGANELEASVRGSAFESELQSLQVQHNTNFSSINLDTISLVGDTTLDDEILESLFSNNCPFQAILFATPHHVIKAMEFKEQFECTNTSIGVFLDDFRTDLNPELYQAITRKQLDFVLDPQIHLQASMSVVLAALYVTTGKKPAFPSDTHTYWTGPQLIHKRNVPSDTTAICQTNAFPVCHLSVDNSDDADAIATTDTSTQVDWLGLDLCPCTQRNDIRIGGVLHGTPGGFWDPVFASAEQAAADMHVTLDLTPFSSKEDFDLLVDQMSARIRNLCEGGVDGLMVSIPDPRVAEAVQRCLDLFVPVISINSGVEESKRMGLMHHVGQNEYAGGFEAAERMIVAGMTKGFCVDHEFGNSALAERCQGFKDAIALAAREQGGVEFREHVSVPRDNDEEFRLNIEGAVGEDGDWEGVGFLQMSASSFRSLRPLLEEHPGSLAAAFDLKDYIYEAIGDNVLQFTIDQQPFLQGAVPIYLLTYFISTRQAISNHLIESGPSFVQELPAESQKQCEANHFAVCPDRPEEDMSYIPSGFLAVGYVLFVLIALFSLGALAWTFFYRDLWVVKVSQPMFLALVVLGNLISGMSIIFMGAQTSYRLDRDESGEFIDAENPDINRVDASCMAAPWLYGIGFVVIFSALLTKILRVRLLFLAGIRMSRKPVTLVDVLPVMAFMLIVELVILSSWQAIAPLRWQREVTDELDGYATESVGTCTSGNAGWGFFLGLVGFHIVCLCYALVLCYQTRQLSNDFAESSYVSLAVAFLFQVLVLAVPILALVRNNAEVYYFVRVATVFLQNITVLSLIFVPKMLRMGENALSATNSHSDPTREGKSGTPRNRGSPGATGIPALTPTTNSNPQTGGRIPTATERSKERNVSWAGSGDTGIVHITDEPEPADIPEGLPKDSWAGVQLSLTEEDWNNSYRHSLFSVKEETASAAFSIDDKQETGQDEKTAQDDSGAQITETDALLSPEEVLSCWDQLGFPSEDFARQFVNLLRRTTDSEKRQSIASGILGVRPEYSNL